MSRARARGLPLNALAAFPQFERGPPRSPPEAAPPFRIVRPYNQPQRQTQPPKPRAPPEPAEPLKIELDPACEIIDARILKVSRAVTKFAKGDVSDTAKNTEDGNSPLNRRRPPKCPET
jgi:hypothetical protein